MRMFAALLGLVLVCSQAVLAQPAQQAGAKDAPNPILTNPTYDEGIEPVLPRVSDDAISFNWHNRLPMKFRPWAYTRMGYVNVDNYNNANNNVVGNNDGFFLDTARIGMDATLADQLSMRVSIDGASDLNDTDPNTTVQTIDVSLQDAFVRWDPVYFLGIQVGQFKAPFDQEELESTADLLFIDRAVGQQGVPKSQGNFQASLAVDRQLGVMLSSHGPVPLSRYGLSDAVRNFGVGYYFMACNGNGQNQLLNDNSQLALIGRLEAAYSNIATLGAAYLHNDRNVSPDPYHHADENDHGFDVDLLVTPFGGDLDFFFQFEQIKTDYPTVGVPDRTQEAWHVQVGYKFHTPWVHITPAYRFAEFDPWANGNQGQTAGLDLSSYRLDYHTFGLRIGHNELPLLFFFNYTITEEQAPRELHNNLLQLLVQVSL